MAEAHGNPEKNDQLIRISMIIITNALIFAVSFEKWNNKADADKTWQTSMITSLKNNIITKEQDPATP